MTEAKHVPNNCAPAMKQMQSHWYYEMCRAFTLHMRLHFPIKNECTMTKGTALLS